MKDLYFCSPNSGIMSGIYSIPLNGLKDGGYSYDFEVSSDFFDRFDSSEIGECRINMVVELKKVASHFNVMIRMKGEVLVTCDRCLVEFYHPVDSENQVVVKIGQEFDDSDPELLIIPAGQHEIDLSQMIYDFAHLSLPLKRVHPTGRNGKSECDPQMIAMIGQSDDEEQQTNPEWDKLKGLIHKN
jgi:uncharacterized metal-binding protein YceD (DUF177 family)